MIREAMAGGRKEPYTAHELIDIMAKTTRKEIEVMRGVAMILASAHSDDAKAAEFKAKADVQISEMQIAAAMIEGLLVSAKS